MADLQKILKDMIGGSNADAVHKTVEEAQKALDTAGVTRKAASDTTPADGGDAVAGTAALEAVDAAGATEVAATVKQVLDALKSMNALVPDVDMNALIAALVKAVAAPEAAEENPADPAARGDQSAMADEMMKSLTDYIATTTKDMGDIAKGQVLIAETLKASREDNAKLIGRIEALEKQLGGRPRQASKDPETVIDKTTVMGKEALSAVQKSLGEETTVVGLRVRKS